MRLEQLDYELPSNLIATKPAVPRDQARLMVVHSSSGRIEHHRISDLPDHLDATDIMVRNRSRVLPARIEGSRVDTGGRVSGLYLHSLDDGSWVAMLKSNGKLRSGLSIQLGEDGPVLELLGRDGASWLRHELAGRGRHSGRNGGSAIATAAAADAAADAAAERRAVAGPDGGARPRADGGAEPLPLRGLL